MAARLHGLDEAQIEVDRGIVRLPDRELSILEVLKPGLGPLGGELIGNGETRKEAEKGHPLSGSAAFFEFNCTAVEVEVDEGTGDITIVRHVTVSDVGKALNPLQVKIAGRGRRDPGARPHPDGALHLRRRRPDPQPRRDRLPDPDEHGPAERAGDRDRSRTRTGPVPYGSKGMSEGALLCVAPAVAAAVRDATGAVIRDLPLTPERVWRALQQRDARVPVEVGR